METNVQSNIVIAGTSHLTKRPHDTPCNVIELMCEATQRAAEDAGNDAILSVVDQIIVPQGTWTINNPGGLVAQHLGIPAKSITYNVGILQSSLIKRAIEDVNAAKSRCTLIVGGEAKDYERNVSESLHAIPTLSDSRRQEFSEFIQPAELPISRYEIDMGLINAPDQYALIENAYAHAHKLTRESHQELINNEWEEMARIADSIPSSWIRDAHDHLKNNGWGRTIATPYMLHHVTQWNVNQAAAILITTEDVAEIYSKGSDEFIFPNALIESNAVIPLSERRQLHHCNGLHHIKNEYVRLTGMNPSESQFHELYSCFPIAVRLQRAAFELGKRPGTITGGMTFAGGPYNNFMLQGLSQLAKQVRESHTTGVITSVSGMLTKQGLISLSTEQPPSGMYLSDVSDKTQSRTERMQIEPEMCGNAKVVSSTVSYSAGAPQVYVLVENHDKQRRLLISGSDTVIEEFLKSHKIGDTIHMSQEGLINL
ncbi:MAG: hypothetical protein VX480_06010 [Actinomycetota bacterium]|nr:hypothetical protein [Actinomycetota bacterium]